MRIEGNQIKIAGRLMLTELLKDAKPGSMLSAAVAEKLGKTHAILNIGGRLVRAEFLNGVPDSRNISLILDKKTGNTLLFKIVDESRQETFKSEFRKFTVLNNSDPSKSVLHDINRYIKHGAFSIFALNKALLKLPDSDNEEKNKNNKLKDLFNRLLLKGLKHDNLILIASLVQNGNSRAIQQFLFLMSQVIPGDYQFFSDTDDKIKEQIDAFAGLIDNNLSIDEKSEIIPCILDILTNSQNNNQCGEFVFLEDREFRFCKFIYDKKSIIVSLDLTSLGHLEILMKDEKDFFSALFFCEDDSCISALRDNINELESSLKLNLNKKIHASFYKNKDAKEKIIEIISSMNVSYLIDEKV